MKKINSILKGRKYIAFLDFEGTQFSHEMIAIGGVLVSLDKNDRIKKMKEPFKILVKAKNKIGSYVVDLTHITEEMLKTDGVTFHTALTELKKYLGLRFKKCLFVTYGNHDMRILNQSIAYNFSYPKDVTSQIQKNYLDYASVISEFVRDDNGNPLSLVKNCELFGVKIAEPIHDPASDAINLANLYDAFLAHPEIVEREYIKSLLKVNHFPDPIRRASEKLVNGEDLSVKEFNSFVKDYLK
ncbi:MAG: hypothetical protein K6C32_00645 [Bacilli bacterium]|nr:hypothetical protein [Bacilli bacterium]